MAEARGDIEEADRSMIWAVRMNRTNPWIHIAEGRYLERQGRAEEAFKAYENARALGGSPEVYEALGRALFRLGRDVDAVAVLEAAGSEEAYARLAVHFMELGDKAHGKLILEQWSAWGPNQKWLEARVALANWLEEQSVIWSDYVALLSVSPNLDVASRALEAAVGACSQGALWKWARENRATSRSPGWRKWVAEVAESSGDLRWYERLLTERAAVDGENELLSAHLLAERRFGALKEHALARLELTPESLDARRDLGAAYRGMHRYDDAVAEWEGILAREPTAEETARMLIQLRLDQGLSTEALALGERFVAATGESTSARALYARVVAGVGDLDGALEVAEALPDDVRYTLLVEILLEAGEWERAWTVASEAEAVELMVRAASWASRLDRDERAVEVWSELLKRGVVTPSSRALYELHAVTLEEALRLSPCDPELLKEAWEEGESCEELKYLRQAYDAFPALFADSYSRGSARCGFWPEATSAAQWALRIEDSEARRRHLDYVQRAAEKFERARRKP
jgi:tetratricopeptide (TPR) repeat protein